MSSMVNFNERYVLKRLSNILPSSYSPSNFLPSNTLPNFTLPL